MEVITKKHLEDFTRKLLESDKKIRDSLDNKISDVALNTKTKEALIIENSHVAGNKGSVIKKYNSKRCHVFIPLENNTLKFYWEGNNGSTNLSSSSTKVLITNGTELRVSISLLSIVESAVSTNGYIIEHNEEQHYAVIDCDKILNEIPTSTHICIMFDMEGEKSIAGYTFVDDIAIGDLKTKFLDMIEEKEERVREFTNAGDIAYTSNASDVYVSITGSDSNSGISSDKAVSTITKAIEIANTLTHDIVNIHIADGEYRLENTTINSDKQLKFFGNGNTTVVKGSKKLTNYTKVSDTVYKFPVQSSTRLYQIFVNDEIRLSASTKREQEGIENMCTIPAGTTYEGTGKYILFTIPFSSNDINVLSTYKDDLFLTIFRQWRSYKTEITEIDSTNNVIKVYLPTGGNANITEGDLFIVENIMGALDINGGNECFTEGTYYHDIVNGFLYYKLKADESIDDITIEVPVCDQININCKATFSNIKFSQFNGNIMGNTEDSSKKCYLDGQGGYRVGGTFRVMSKNVNFTKCSFYGFTNHCIKYYNGTADSIVEKCHFLHCGCGSVSIGELDNDVAIVPYNIRVHNNVIQYMGELLQQSCGVIVSFADSCKVSNNEISYINYSGITGGHSWDFEKTAYKNCKYNYNHIHHINYNKTLHDMGGIYMVGRSRNADIVGNKIHDIMGHRLCSGVYLDEGSSDIKMRNNIIYNISGSGYYAHRSKNNDVYNNIFAFISSQPISYQARTGDSGEDRCYSNIVYGDDQSVVYTLRASVTNCEINSNLYYCTNGNGVVDVDKNAVYLDPMFKDPDTFDFSITDASNIDNIEFETFEDKAGVKGSIMKALII